MVPSGRRLQYRNANDDTHQPFGAGLFLQERKFWPGSTLQRIVIGMMRVWVALLFALLMLLRRFWAWLLGTYLVTLVAESVILARYFWAPASVGKGIAA